MKLFLKLLLIVGLINPAASFARGKDLNTSHHNTQAQVSDSDKMSDSEEIEESQDQKPRLGKIVLTIGTVAVALFAAYSLSGGPYDPGSPDGNTEMFHILNLD